MLLMYVDTLYISPLTKKKIFLHRLFSEEGPSGRATVPARAASLAGFLAPAQQATQAASTLTSLPAGGRPFVAALVVRE